MTKSTPASVLSHGLTRRSFVRGCLFAALVAAGGLLTPGCGCRNMNWGRGSGGLDGTWTATLNPETVAIDVPLTLRSAEGGVLTGSIGAASLEAGKYSGKSDGSTIEFQTAALTVEGPTGEITVDGPLNWKATLRDGKLDGTVSGADGRTTRWTARRIATSTRHATSCGLALAH